MVGKVSLQYRRSDIDPREDYPPVNVGRGKMIKAHEVYRFDGILFSEKACRESEVRELENKLDDAQNERDDQTVSVMKPIVKNAKMEVENKSIKKQLDMAVEALFKAHSIMKDYYCEVDFEGSFSYRSMIDEISETLSKLKDNQEKPNER